MAVDIISISHNQSDTPLTPSPFLVGSFLDKITTIVIVSVHWESINVLCTFNATSQTITRNDNQSFINDEFSVGDTFDVVGSGSNDGSYTIATISTNGQVITTVEALVNESTTCSFYGTTPINALNFYFNLIENNQQLTFNSLTDTNTACLKVASGNPFNVGDTNNLVQATTSLGWDNGSGTIRRLVDVGYERRFDIEHTYFISPYYLAGEPVCSGEVIGNSNIVPNAQAILSWGQILPPNYFYGNNSLKYVCKVDAKYSLANPNIYHTTDINYPFPLGNVGYLNEFLNGGTPNYSYLEGYLLENAFCPQCPMSTYNSGTIDLGCVETVFNFYIHVADGSVTTGGFGVGTLMIINLFYCPQDNSRYTNTPTNMNENFLLDRIVMGVGNSNINGENFGTAYQGLWEGYGNPIDANTILGGCAVYLSPQIKAFLLSRPAWDRHLMLTCTFQNPSVTDMQLTDRNTVLLYYKKSDYDLQDPTLISFSDTLFFQYPDTTTNGTTDYKGIVGDLVLSKSYFTIDNTAILSNFKAEIQAINTVTGESIVLQSTNNAVQSADSICEKVEETNRYKLPDNSPYNQTVFQRNVAFDTETVIGYEFDYGFILRYETWVKVPEAAQAFKCENYQDWSIYSLEPNWQVALVLTADATKNDYTTTFIHTCPITVKDETFTDDGFGGQITSSITTYYQDNTGYVDAKGMIFSDRNTHVILTCIGNFTSLPLGRTGYGGYLGVDLIDTGGVFFRDIITSDATPLNDSIWAYQAFVSKVDNSTVTIECDIDYTKLNKTYTSMEITGRLYFKY